MIDCVYLTGVFLFSMSGAIAATQKKLDWVGVTALALATALGGGTVRDIILNRNIFWLEQPEFIWVSVLGSFFTILYLRFLRAPNKSLLFFDAIGLAFFSILGAKITSELYSSIAIIVLLSLLTGVFGGVIRDVLSNQVPYLFRPSETLYSISALAGIIIYCLLNHFEMSSTTVECVSIATIILIRIFSIYFNVTLPVIKTKI